MKRWMTVALVVAVQVIATGWAVQPQLSARLTGTEYRVRVAPVDPIDPFRGAYVRLTYPDLRPAWDDPSGTATLESDEADYSGPIYLVLERAGDVMVTRERVRERPARGPYLACHTDGWNTDCGIESWFLPESKAAALEDRVQGGTVLARIKVDGRGNAALLGLE